MLDVEHQRHAMHLPLGQVVVQVTGETRDAAHTTEVAQALEKAGYVQAGISSAQGIGGPMRFVSKEVQS